MAGGHTYYEAVWCEIEEEQGRQDWTALDRVADRSARLGVTLLLKLRVGRCWATPGEPQYARGNKTESAMPENLDTYRTWVRDLVQRYSAKGVHKYAIENEINSNNFWVGTPEQFNTMAQAAAESIRGADPDAVVVDAGLSSTTYGYGIAKWLLDQGREADAVAAYNSYFERRIGTRGRELPRVSNRGELEAVLGSEQGMRNLSYLRLMPDLRRRGVVDVRQIHFYEKYTSVPLLFSYLRATTPPDTPIEAWEVGSFFRDGPTASEQRTSEVLKTLSLVLAEGASVAIWLPLAFDPGGRNPDEPRLGLLDPDGRVREAGRIFQSVLEASLGAEVTRISRGGLTGVAFERKGTTTAFAWSDSGSVVQLSSGETALPVGQDDKPGTSGAVSIGEEPMQLTLKRSPDSLQVTSR
jgi:hypothetical protein